MAGSVLVGVLRLKLVTAFLLLPGLVPPAGLTKLAQDGVER